MPSAAPRPVMGRPLEQPAVVGLSAYGALRRAFPRVFVDALLLTSDPTRAEHSVLSAIEAWEPDREDEAEMLEGVRRRCVKTYDWTCPATPAARAAAAALLPPELGAILWLSPGQRVCYVLRVLARWSRSQCAHALSLSAAEVDRLAFAAIGRLAEPHAPVVN